MKIDRALSLRFQFIADALHGSGGFAPHLDPNTTPNAETTYLVRYPRESADKFARRQRIAWYRNFLHPACERFAGYLARKPPIRDIRNPLLQKMVDDCDWRGNSLEVFFHGFAIDAKARGSMLLLVDMPKAVPPNQAEQMAARAFPYLVAIAPERVIEYALNDQGRLALVAFLDSVENANGMQEPVWRVYTEQAWWVQRPGSLATNPEAWIEGAEHGLGLCPVLAFTESGDFPAVGSFGQIAELSRRYYNAAAERDEILRAQTFSLLTYQVGEKQSGFDAGQVAEAIGTHNMLMHHGATPAFIAPPDGPATIYSQVLQDLEEAIRRIAMTVEQPAQAESGVALTIRFQELNSALTGFARRMEDFERRIWDMAARWLNMDDNTEISWPKSYELADLEMELNILQTMQSTGFPPEVIRTQMESVVGLQFGTHDAADVEALMESVRDAGAEIMPGEPAGQAVAE